MTRPFTTRGRWLSHGLALFCIAAFAVACGGAEDSTADGTDEPADGTTAAELAALPGQAFRMTLFEDTGYGGSHVTRELYDRDLRNDDFNDKASSVVNKTGHYWLLFSDRDYGGGALCIRPYSHVYDLHNYFWDAHRHWWNDTISSMQRRTEHVSSCEGWQVAGHAN